MKLTDQNPDQNYVQLRQGAEAKFVLAPEPEPRPAEDMLYELQMYQTELEMQNEQLRQAQIELEASRDRYVDFYDFAPAGYFTLNHEGTICEANLTAAEMIGAARSNLLQRRFAHSVAPVDRDRWHRHFISVLKHDNKLSCELLFQRCNGTRFYALLDCLRLKKDGKETMLRVALTDISERVKLEKEKQKAYDRFEKITQLMPGIIYQFQLHPNGGTCMPYVSDAFARIFRLNPAEVRKDAAKAFARVHQDDLENLMASIQASARDLTPWQHEFRLKFDDGTICWLSGNSLPQREADGATLWYGFITDITARKLAEKLLKENELQLAAIINNAPTIIFMKDMAGRYLLVNSMFEKVFKISNAAIVGKTDRDLFPQNIADMFMEADQKVIQSGLPIEIEENVPQNDGTRTYITFKFPLLNVSCEIYAVCGISTDITWRNQAERTLLNYTNELALHNRILKLIGQDVALLEILDELVREAETLHPEVCCSITLLDKDGKHMCLSAAQSHRIGLDMLPTDDDKCSCGDVVHGCMNGCCTSVGVADIRQRGCRLARLVGMQFCRAQPIVNSKNLVLGTFTVYHRQAGLPEGTATSLLENYANLAMLAIERDEARLVLQSEQELKAYQKAARGFSTHLQTILEEEKTRIAREIHDDLGGTLTALKMETYWLVEEFPANMNPAPFLKHTDQMAQLVDEATNAMRRIITGLRPAMLDDLGLLAACEWHAAQFNKFTDIECEVTCVMDEYNENRLSKAQSINLFRIFQEALTNVAKHSHASRVAVEFCCSDEEFALSVSDNGCGVPENHVIDSNSYGILGMTERVGQMCGKIKFGSPPGGGFSLTIILPLVDNTEGEDT